MVVGLTNNNPYISEGRPCPYDSWTYNQQLLDYQGSYHTVTTTLANLGAVGCMSNYHTVTTTLGNLGAVGCKSNYHTDTDDPR